MDTLGIDATAEELELMINEYDMIILFVFHEIIGLIHQEMVILTLKSLLRFSL